MADAQKPEAMLDEARSRLTGIAVGMRALLGTVNAAGVLAGAAICILRADLGDERAAEYFRSVAGEIERDAPRTVN